MKLKPVIKGMKDLKTQPKEGTRKKQENSLPSDEYKPLFPPKKFLVREVPSAKDPTRIIKQYVEISVKRFNDDAAMPFVWLQMFQESDLYTGYMKGKSVYLPVEMLYDLIEQLQAVDEECEKRGI